MKILIHSTILDSEPLEADGIALEGKNCAELVEIMKGQTLFTIEAAAAEFLTLLGKHGLMEFLPTPSSTCCRRTPLTRRMTYVRTSR